jgi:hypothetical protein
MDVFLDVHAVTVSFIDKHKTCLWRDKNYHDLKRYN